jgi:hypothetical protein
MCNCVRDNEKRLGEYYSKVLGVPASAEAKNVAFILGKGVHEAAYLPYNIKADKRGYNRSEGKEVSMFFNFCPFCGVELETKDHKSD